MSGSEFNDPARDATEEPLRPLASFATETFEDPLSDPKEDSVRSVRRNRADTRHVDNVRAVLAIGLLALLAVITLTALVAVVAGASLDRVKGIAEVLLPPIVALAGSATGFYFASSADGGPR